jgi:hypothetical protein
MNGIILNIIAYVTISIVMYLICGKYIKELETTEEKETIKLKLSGSILLMIWSIFMSMYLIIDYKEILNAPLNIRLNFFETITNFILPYFMLVDVFSKEIINIFRKK